MKIHITKDGQQYGPFTLAQVNTALAGGELSPDDLAWHEGAPSWIMLGAVHGVVAPALRPPMPPPPPADTSGRGIKSHNSNGHQGNVSDQATPNFSAILKFGGILCYVFAVIDFAGMFLGYDLTGVSWSPIVAGLVGSVLVQFGEGKSELS